MMPIGATIGQVPPGGAPADLVFMTTFQDGNPGDSMSSITPEYSPSGATLGGIYTKHSTGAASGVGGWSGVQINNLPAPTGIIRQIHLMYYGTADWHTSKDQGMHWYSHNDAAGNNEGGYFNHYTNVYATRARTSGNTSDNGNVLQTAGVEGIGCIVITVGDEHIHSQMFAARHTVNTGNSVYGAFLYRPGGSLTVGAPTNGINFYGKPTNTTDAFRIMCIAVWDHDVSDFKWAG